MQRLALLLFLALVLTSVPGCGGGEDENIGATASLSWNPVNHATAVVYTVHYGSESAGNSGACVYELTQDVSEPFVTITGLEFDKTYYFAVSAYTAEEGLRSDCSNEVSKKTKPEQPEDTQPEDKQPEDKQPEDKQPEDKQHKDKQHEDKQHEHKHA